MLHKNKAFIKGLQRCLDVDKCDNDETIELLVVRVCAGDMSYFGA